MSVEASVDEFVASLDHELADVVDLIRSSIKSAVPQVTESIKWKAPNFALADDFATLNLRRPTAVQVILHTGPKPKPEHPKIEIDDPAALLRWADSNRAIVTFTSRAETLATQPAFVAIVRDWVRQLQH
ncbi:MULTISPECIES: DUF1801 domain-containing protein [unclassified Salinibacterium]|uniref:DUF1801 domain-containing protein n=1 Tax=unclassified Salinibacterium TaxID=2632331 RepID=UPI001422C03B|nr:MULTISPECIES: DUF1801 domain-containing protein [unclassified Salinibacterium]